MQRIRHLLRNLFGKSRAESELDAEVRAYLEQLTEEKIAAGMPPEDARRAALVELGGQEQVKEQVREARAGWRLEQFAQDLRYGLRTLRNSPGFTTVAVLTLALGIGANTAIFSLVEGLRRGAAPVQDPASLVQMWQARPGQAGGSSLSYADYLYYREHNQTFSAMAAHYSGSPMSLVDAGEQTPVNGSVVTANYFSLLGLRPALGRFFTPEEDAVPGRDPVVVISHRLWQRGFGGDTGILGTTVQLNGTAFTVVGVAPEGFQAIALGFPVSDVWIPSAMFQVGYRYCDALARGCTIVSLFGRLRPGRTRQDAQSEMDVLAGRLAEEYPATNQGLGIVVAPLEGLGQQGGDDNAQLVSILLVAVALVLLIACANLAGLLLSRGVRRRKEIAVRLALGASRGRLIRQLLTESLLLSLLGGAAGLLIAVWSQRLLLSFYTVDYAGRGVYFDLPLDLRILLFATGLSFLTGVVFGLVPAALGSRLDLVPALKGGEATLGRRFHLRDALVVVQIAVSMVLLAGAGLLVRSVQNIFRGPGFDPSHIALVRLRPSLVGHSNEKGLAFQAEVIRRLEALPGVLAASPARMNAGGGNTATVWHPGNPPARRGEGFQAFENRVGPRFFATIGLPVLEGREFDQRDRSGSQPVAIVDQTLARHFWPGQAAVGQPLVVQGEECIVVGVVQDTHFPDPNEPALPFVYRHYWQMSGNNVWNDSRTHVRVAGDPAAMRDAIRRAISAVDPDVPIQEDYPIVERIAYTFAKARGARTLLLCFGGLALFLSAIGLYGVLALSVSQRTREIAIRMALGADRSNAAALILRRGILLAVIGAAIGLSVAAGLGHTLAALLYGVSPRDGIAFSAAAALIAAVAVAGSLVPARRAMRVDPMVALRHE